MITKYPHPKNAKTGTELPNTGTKSELDKQIIIKIKVFWARIGYLFFIESKCNDKNFDLYAGLTKNSKHLAIAAKLPEDVCMPFFESIRRILVSETILAESK